MSRTCMKQIWRNIPGATPGRSTTGIRTRVGGLDRSAHHCATSALARKPGTGKLDGLFFIFLFSPWHSHRGMWGHPWHLRELEFQLFKQISLHWFELELAVFTERSLTRKKLLSRVASRIILLDFMIFWTLIYILHRDLSHFSFFLSLI